jgi:tetratricopeptide (TPR) repeat protein
MAMLAQLSSPSLPSDPSTQASRHADPSALANEPVAVLSGKVVSEDNTPPGVSGSVVLQCATEVRARRELDTRGYFVLSLADAHRQSSDVPGLGKDAASLSDPWMGCELYADIPGYSSERLRLEGNPGMGVVQVGRIIIHPIAPEASSFAVSVTSLAAPDKAKKAFQEGKEQERKGRWASACHYFQRAVSVYPRYALAWLELGRSELKQNSFREAEQSFEQAIRQDSRLLDGYAELAQLAVGQKSWKELVDVTARLLQLSPQAGPQYWFFNSAAHFNLNQMSEAESAIEHGMRLDANHQVPQMEFLYGLILARKKDYQAAGEHIRAYLRLSPNVNDAEMARKTLSEIARLTGVETAKP